MVGRLASREVNGTDDKPAANRGTEVTLFYTVGRGLEECSSSQDYLAVTVRGNKIFETMS